MRGELNFIVIFFFYGLAFFSMGLLVMLEGGRASDPGLRKALRPLAAFGLLHAAHEWVEMYEIIAVSFGVELPTMAACNPTDRPFILLYISGRFRKFPDRQV